MLVTAPVQTDKTSESITEIVNEYAAYLSTVPTTEDELVEVLEDKFGDWSSNTNSKFKTLSTVALPNSRTVYLIDKPNAQQSYIVAGQLLPPSATDEEIKISYMNYAIGGSFTARLNMNLREDKSWS